MNSPAPIHPHIHISTEFMISAGVMLLIALCIIAWIVREFRTPKPSAAQGFTPPVPPPPRPATTPHPVFGRPTSVVMPSPSPSRASPFRSAPESYREAYRPAAPSPAPTQGVESSGIGAGTGFLAGMAGGVLLSEAMHDRPNDPPPPYEAPPWDVGPSPSSSEGGFSYDSGPSASDGGGSGDGGSSGGLDIQW